MQSAPTDFEPTGPLAERLTDDQRAQMQAHFRAVEPQKFYVECWVYLGRELRFRPRHRDWRGIADLLRIAMVRGLAAQFEAAADRVEVEVMSDIGAPEEVKARPKWEKRPVRGKRRGKRRAKVRKELVWYPSCFWTPTTGAGRMTNRED